MDYASRFVVGTGTALHVELGFIPDYVRVVNLSDRDIITEGSLDPVIHFNSGGDDELLAGMLIVQSDALGTWAQIKQVLVYSGTWAGGNAAGFLVLEPGVGNGTFGNSKILRVAPARQNPLSPPGGAAGNWATTTGTAYLPTSVGIAAAVAGTANANASLAPYSGTIPNAPDLGVSKGVTLGLTVSEDNKLLHVAGWREGAH